MFSMTVTEAPYMTAPWYETELPFEHGAARIIEDSISPAGIRLTSFETILWRPMLAENNTHRNNSKNCASSRAIPPRRKNPGASPGTLDLVEEFPAGPLYWGSEKPGMQSGEELEGDDLLAAQSEWLAARDSAVAHAERLIEIGLHKSIVNRILEPFMWVKILQTSTSWQNMFNQRARKLTDQAQREMAAPIDTYIDLLEMHEPRLIKPGQWHTPYILPQEREEYYSAQLKQISSARCARTSYVTFERVLDPMADIGLFEKLRDARPMHASPFEHVATPIAVDMPEAPGNFRGYRQFRHEVEEQNGIESWL